MLAQGCTQPPLATYTCSSWHMWQAGRGTRHRGRGHRGRETVVHMCRVVNRHVGTLFLDTHRGARKRGESGTHEEEAHAVRSWKTEVNRKKTDVDSYLEVKESESQRDE